MTLPGVGSATGGRAAIEIIGDVSKLGPQVERDVQRALDDVDVDTKEIADDLARGFKEGAREGVDALQEVDRQAQLTSKKVVTSTDAAGREVKRTFQTIAREGKITTTVVEKSFDAAGDEIERTFKFAAVSVAESDALIALVNREAADSAADSWERAGERIERAFAEAKREAVVDQAEMAAAATATAATVGKQGGIISRIFSRVGEGVANVALSLAEMAASDLNPAGLISTLISVAATLGAIALLAGPILTVAAAVGELAGALTLLPAAGFAAAASITTLVIAFHGFGDAIGAIIKGDPEKIAAALKKLAPEARAVALEFQKLLPAFREVGQLIQQRFFIQLEGDLTRLSGNLLPTVRNGLAGIATELGAVVSSIGEALTTPQAKSDLKVIFDETANAIHSAADDFDRFTSGILSAAAALAPAFADISGTLTDIVGNFGDWLKQSAEDGSLQEFLDNAIATGKSLFNLLGSLGGLFKTILGGDAAEEGRNFIDSIASGIDDLNAALQSPEGQEFLQRLIDSTKLLAKLFGAAVDAAAFLIDAAHDVQTATNAVIDFLKRSGNDVRRFWEGLTEAVSNAWNAVVGFFTSTGSAISDWWTELTDTVSSAVDSIIGWFKALPGQIADFLQSLPGLVADFFDQAINSVIDFIGTATGVIVGLITELPGQLMGAGAALLAWVQGLLSQLGDLITSAWVSLVDFFRSIPDRIADVWATIVDTATSAFDSIARWVAGVWAGIVDGASQLPGKITNFFAGIYAGAVDKLTALWNWVKGLPGRILSALGDLGSLLYNSGAKVIQGLIDGIASKFQRLKDKIAEGVQIIRDHLPFSPAKTGPLSGGGSPQIAGAKIAEMIAAGLDSNLPLIADAASRAASATQLGGSPVADAGGLPLITPQPGQPGTVLSPVDASTEKQEIFVVQIGNEEIGAYIAKRVDEAVQIEVRRLLTGARGAV